MRSSLCETSGLDKEPRFFTAVDWLFAGSVVVGTGKGVARGMASSKERAHGGADIPTGAGVGEWRSTREECSDTTAAAAAGGKEVTGGGGGASLSVGIALCVFENTRSVVAVGDGVSESDVVELDVRLCCRARHRSK